MQTSSYHHREGGIWRSIQLNELNRSLDDLKKDLISDGVIIGVLLFMGLYHIVLYILLPSKDPSPLYLGFFCIIIFLRTTSMSDSALVQTSFQGNLSNWGKKFEFLGLSLGAPLFYSFGLSMFKEDFSKRLEKIVWSVGGLMSVLVLFNSNKIYGHLLPLIQMNVLLCISSGIIFFALALKRKRPEIKIVATTIKA